MVGIVVKDEFPWIQNEPFRDYSFLASSIYIVSLNMMADVSGDILALNVIKEHYLIFKDYTLDNSKIISLEGNFSTIS